MTMTYPKADQDNILRGGNHHTVCGKRHYFISSVAECKWGPRTIVEGDGPYALTEPWTREPRRRPHTLVHLFETEAELREALARHRNYCPDGNPADAHQIYELRLEDGHGDGLCRHPAHP